jgi:hypothetical protein
MTEFLAKLSRGLPVTLIAALAIVVLGAWIVGGVGRTVPRIAVGVSWLLAVVTCWGVLLYGPESGRKDDLFPWVTYALTAASFLLPIVWRRISWKQ